MYGMGVPIEKRMILDPFVFLLVSMISHAAKHGIFTKGGFVWIGASLARWESNCISCRHMKSHKNDVFEIGCSCMSQGLLLVKETEGYCMFRPRPAHS